MPLREVADVAVAVPGRLAENGRRARAQREEAEQDAEERRLAGSVRAENGDELAGLDRQVDAAPDRLDRRSRLWRPAARRRAARSSPGRSVQGGDQRARARRLPLLEARASPARASRSRSRPGCARPARGRVAWSTSGVTFWLLKTQTLTWCRRSCRSTVSLSLDADLAALGDRLGEAGRREEPQAEARAERLEDALAVADGHAGEAAADLGAQRVVASERLGLEPALPRGEVARRRPGRRGRRRR